MIMGKICESLMQTRNNLATYQFLNDQISSSQAKIAPKFFQTASNAVLHEVILGITRLTDENQGINQFQVIVVYG